MPRLFTEALSLAEIATLPPSPMDDVPYPEPTVIGGLVRTYCQMHGGVSRTAVELAVPHGDLSRMASGKLRPNAKVLAALGFRKVELYIPDDVPVPPVGYPYRQEAA